MRSYSFGAPSYRDGFLYLPATNGGPLVNAFLFCPRIQRLDDGCLHLSSIYLADLHV